MSKLENDDKKIDWFPKNVFNVMPPDVTNNFSNLYLAHNKFFYRLVNSKGDTKCASLLYKKLVEDNNRVLSCCNESLLTSLNFRSKVIAQSFKKYCCIEYVPETRLIIGTGAESPYSSIMLMTLHQTYGFPYIPATAIKGCLRNYFEQEKPSDINIEKLLGSDSNSGHKSKGCLVFFDVFPTKFTLTFDVMTPHNSDYYTSEGEKTPTDTEKKIPLFFPCVTEKTNFNIYVACTDREERLDDSSRIITSIKAALGEYGLGAKTAYGYGLIK